jgi:membrane protease YdiL (CAAX protease family)
MKKHLNSIQKNYPISSAYIVLLIISLCTLHITYRFLLFFIPFYLLLAPLLFGQKVHIDFKAKNIAIGLAVSTLVLLPFSAVMILLGKQFVTPPFETLLFQFLAVAFPEEFFFRGFVQERIGNNKKGIVITSLLFAGAHLPLSISSGIFIPLLSFFPSLLMGWLYMRTSNILPCVIFHFLANLTFISFGGF